MSSLLRLEPKQKNSSNPFRIRIFLFLSHSFGIETKNTFIRYRSSLENHIRLAKSIPVFSPKRPKIIPFGAGRTHTAYIREYPRDRSFETPFFLTAIPCTLCVVQRLKLIDSVQYKKWPRRRILIFLSKFVSAWLFLPSP